MGDDVEYSTLTIGGRASTAEREQAEFLGFVMSMAAHSALNNRTAISTLVERAKTAYGLGMAHLFFNSYGQCVGYISWAHIARDVEQRFLSTPDASLHISEWNEGNSLWVIDFVVPFGSLRYVLEDLRDRLFAEHRVITYFRFKNGRRIAKRLSRDSVSGFFSKDRSIPECG